MLGLSDQSGFLAGSGFLLPWDVNVRVQHTETTMSEGRRPYVGYTQFLINKSTFLNRFIFTFFLILTDTLGKENGENKDSTNLLLKFLLASNMSARVVTGL